MPTKLITDHHIPHAIIEIVEASKKELDLVSPFWNWKHLARQVASAAKRKVSIRVYLRLEQTNEDFYNNLIVDLLDIGAKVYEVPGLHAKICRNESLAIVGSMNLLASSATASYEAATIVDEVQVLGDIKKYISHLTDIGQQSKRSFLGKIVEKLENALPEQPGFCMRCNIEIPFNPLMPLCGEHYQSWLKYKNRNYKEKYCHDCGKSAITSFNKPVCIDCYKVSRPTGFENQTT